MSDNKMSGESSDRLMGGLLEKLVGAVESLPDVWKETGRRIVLEIESAKRDQPLTIALVGKSGVSKSRTVNFLMGQAVAEVNASQRGTDSTRKYDGSMFGVPYSVFDTPGLADGTNNDASYIKNIADTINKVDVLLYVTPLYEPRALNDERTTIERITAAFGCQIWDRAVIVFTFADYPKGDELLGKIQTRPVTIRRVISEAVVASARSNPAASMPTVDEIPAVPFSNVES